LASHFVFERRDHLGGERPERCVPGLGGRGHFFEDRSRFVSDGCYRFAEILPPILDAAPYRISADLGRQPKRGGGIARLRALTDQVAGSVEKVDGSLFRC